MEEMFLKIIFVL